MTNEKESLWEGRANSILQALVVLILAWIGNTVVDLRTELGVLKSQVASAAPHTVQLVQIASMLKEVEMRQREIERRITQMEERNGVQRR